MTLTLMEQDKIKRDTEERKDLIARQLRDDLHAVLKTNEGRRIWTWVRYELCRLEDAPRDERDGRLSVALGLDAAVRGYPELAEDLINTRAELDRAQAFYHAGLARLREARNGKGDSNSNNG